jgi:hypothetical protein
MDALSASSAGWPPRSRPEAPFLSPVGRYCCKSLFGALGAQDSIGQTPTKALASLRCAADQFSGRLSTDRWTSRSEPLRTSSRYRLNGRYRTGRDIGAAASETIDPALSHARQNATRHARASAGRRGSAPHPASIGASSRPSSLPWRRGPRPLEQPVRHRWRARGRVDGTSHLASAERTSPATPIRTSRNTRAAPNC